MAMHGSMKPVNSRDQIARIYGRYTNVKAIFAYPLHLESHIVTLVLELPTKPFRNPHILPPKCECVFDNDRHGGRHLDFDEAAFGE